MTTLRTDQLERGTRVVLPAGVVRTVETITPSGYVNRDNETIFNVTYAEGRTAEWGHGNTAIARSPWAIAGDQGSAAVWLVLTFPLVAMVVWFVAATAGLIAGATR